EDAPVELGGEVSGDLHGNAAEKIIGMSQFTVDAANGECLAALHHDKGQPRRAGADQIDQQVLEGEDVCGKRLMDGHLLNATYVADCPVMLGTLGMRVVAAYAFGTHDYRRH